MLDMSSSSPPADRAVVALLLDRIGNSITAQGLTLDELIESGRAERDDLLREMYGIEPKMEKERSWTLRRADRQFIPVKF
jgi:hypothetical protein